MGVALAGIILLAVATALGVFVLSQTATPVDCTAIEVKGKDIKVSISIPDFSIANGRSLLSSPLVRRLALERS